MGSLALTQSTSPSEWDSRGSSAPPTGRFSSMLPTNSQLALLHSLSSSSSAAALLASPFLGAVDALLKESLVDQSRPGLSLPSCASRSGLSTSRLVSARFMKSSLFRRASWDRSSTPLSTRTSIRKRSENSLRLVHLWEAGLTHLEAIRAYYTKGTTQLLPAPRRTTDLAESQEFFPLRLLDSIFKIKTNYFRDK